MSDALGSVITRELERLQAKHRCQSSVRCDRCGSAITLSSSMTMALDPHLMRSALALGWVLCRATSEGLGGSVVLQDASHDLCPPCRQIVDAVPASSR